MGERDQINIRCPAEEVAAFRAAAAAVGLDLTTWLRMVARQAAGLPTLGGPSAAPAKPRRRPKP